ncbi:hypothetical protein LTR91_002416 [Friedmanniomyces endolithicus]|uniref:Uncharacterized protein n=1 Tax=Friedmanniomyces endolithicus TaxID=329885 RepID=A0AAN6L0F6_9PEZI|nr:hypothetical protein LTR82_007320 [Friedmanniomyces endolithicus]KAK0919619.1 hypothetical protein LTR57_010616 [Friedmanniomyces endolithicus]KAK1008497.1 hypothetical protein LTS01_002255 [Friedmanniomyces endolithicus]KAK1010581.1 hypothetical protein LTR91_002416 [Friedmanniomyces endolithicus]KAK1037222.1 hypothetical protein LTS16_013075 [Friedmanniomyces endolithicus]
MANWDSLDGATVNFNSAGEFLDDLLGPMNGGYIARVEEASEESIDVQSTGEDREGDKVVPDKTVLWSDRPSAGSKHQYSESAPRNPATGAVYGQEIQFSLADLDGPRTKRVRAKATFTTQSLSASSATDGSSTPYQFVIENPAASYGSVVVTSSSRSLALAGHDGQMRRLGHFQEIFSRTKTGKQNVRQKGQNVEFDSAPDANVPLPHCYASAVEILTYLPHTTKRPSFGVRLRANGLKDEDVAKIQLHARGQATKQTVKKRHAAIRKQMSKNGKQLFGDRWPFKKGTYSLMSTTNYDLSHCIVQSLSRHTKIQLAAPRLVDLAKDIVNPPSAEDSGYLTQAIRYAVENNDTTLTTVNVTQLAFREHFIMPASALAPNSNWDAEGRDRVIGSMMAEEAEMSEGTEDDDDEDDEDDEDGGDDEVNSDGSGEEMEIEEAE